MIIRSPKRDRFTVLQNSTLQNSDLSWEARGLLAYLLSLPENWKTHVTELSNRSPAKYAKNKRIIGELVDFGHIVKSIERDSKGRFSDWVFDVYDEPQCRLPVCGVSPHTGKPDSGSPDSDNQHVKKTHQEKTQAKKQTPLLDIDEVNASRGFQKTNSQKKPSPSAMSKNANRRSFLNEFGFSFDPYSNLLDENEAMRVATLKKLDATQIQRALGEFSSMAARGFSKSAQDSWFWACDRQSGDGLAHTSLGDKNMPKFE